MLFGLWDLRQLGCRCALFAVTAIAIVAVLVVLPHVGNLSSRELTLLGQAFVALVNVELRNQR
jgi:hypothetical protein